MKQKFTLRFTSIYVKFTVAFLGIWWMLNALTFGTVIHVVSANRFAEFVPYIRGMSDEVGKIKVLIGAAFFASACMGTVIILLVLRGIVKPIKQLGAASKEVAKGNFDVEVRVNSADEVGRLTDDFNTMVRELKSIDILRKDFVSNVSHEFRTPVTSIKGFARLIRDDQLSKEQRFEYSDIIVSESERLIELSSNLLWLSELDSQVIREKSMRFSLDEQIRKTILFLEPQWAKKHIEFDVDLEETEYAGEEDLLRQVWLNLIQNAIKFSEESGFIRVSLYGWNNNLQIKIKDNGVGISDEYKAHVFDRFFTGDKSHSKSGNGLGLSIVHKIVTLLGGNVSVESERGKGTTFIVELPKQVV